MAYLYAPDFQIDYKDWTGSIAVPGHFIWPVLMRQEPHPTEVSKFKDEKMHRMVLKASCAPVRTLFGHHWALRHLPGFTGPMGWTDPRTGRSQETIWCANGPAQPYYEMDLRKGPGCFYLTEPAPQLAPNGNDGWGWIRTRIWNWENQYEKMHLPCEGHVASVNVSTKLLGPGLYQLNLNFGDLVDKTYVYAMRDGQEWEVPMIFEPGFLYIRDSSGWYKPDLGIMHDIRPQREFEPVEIPIPPRGPVWP